jgi:hypothetical protein
MSLLLIDSMAELPNFMGSGLLGLGKRDRLEPTFVEMLHLSGAIPKAEFSLYLNPGVCE